LSTEPDWLVADDPLLRAARRHFERAKTSFRKGDDKRAIWALELAASNAKSNVGAMRAIVELAERIGERADEHLAVRANRIASAMSSEIVKREVASPGASQAVQDKRQPLPRAAVEIAADAREQLLERLSHRDGGADVVRQFRAAGASEPVKLDHEEKVLLAAALEDWLREVGRDELPQGIYEMRNALIDDLTAPVSVVRVPAAGRRWATGCGCSLVAFAPIGALLSVYAAIGLQTWGQFAVVLFVLCVVPLVAGVILIVDAGRG
jgi:hypothetical protein